MKHIQTKDIHIFYAKKSFKDVKNTEDNFFSIKSRKTKKIPKTKLKISCKVKKLFFSILKNG